MSENTLIIELGILGEGTKKLDAYQILVYAVEDATYEVSVHYYPV